MKQILVFAVIAFAVGVAACGGSPTSPQEQTSASANRAPSIISMSVTPQFGIQSLTLFTFAANASDADGDPLTYTWNFGGGTLSGSSVTGTFSSGGDGTAAITVSDGRGGSATDSRAFVVGSASGSWMGSGQDLGSFTMGLTQTAGFITGSYNDSEGSGQIDPAQPGSINSSGQIEMRVKQGQFTDWTFRGTLSQTGRQINGQIFGSGFTGQAFVMNK